jgi:heat shock protein HslJ
MLRGVALLLAAFSVATALAACGGGEDTTAGDLQGVTWQWQGSLYNDDSEAAPDDPSRYTIEFADDGTAAIQADCNSIGAEYEANDGELSVVLGPSTLVACEEDSLSQRFMLDLEGAAGYFFDDEGLLRIDIKFDTGTMTLAPA